MALHQNAVKHKLINVSNSNGWFSFKNNGIQAFGCERPVRLRRGPVAPERALQEAVSVSLEMADVPKPLERPLPGGGGDAEDAERGVGDVPADAAARWVGVPAEL